MGIWGKCNHTGFSVGVGVAVTLLPMLIHTCINPHTTKVDSDCMADINHMGTCEFTQPSHTMKNTSKLWNSCNLCCVVTADPINGGVRFRNPVDSRCTMQTS